VNALPFLKFFPRDHTSDVALRSLPDSARLAWDEMLWLMHAGEPYGHLAIKGKAIELATLAQLVAMKPAVLKRSVAELEAAGVFSRTPEGTIYCRRMVRDEDVRSRRAAGGHLGGNPALGRKVTNVVGSEDNLPPDLSRAGARALRSEPLSSGLLETEESSACPPRKPATGPNAEVIAHHAELYQRAYGERYAFAGAKDGSIVAAMLELAAHDVALVKAKIDRAFADDWCREAGCTLTLIRGRWANLVEASADATESRARIEAELAASRSEPRLLTRRSS
jgi:hypothetical protein